MDVIIKQCSVPGCSNDNVNNPNITLFCRKNCNQEAIWFQRIGLNNKKTFYICAEHFASEDILGKSSGNAFLSTKALPIHNLPKLKNQSNDVAMTSQSVQTDAIQTVEQCVQTTFKSNSKYEIFISYQKKDLLLKLKRNLKLSKPDLKFTKQFQFEMYTYQKLVKKLLPESLRKFIIFQQHLKVQSSSNEYTNEYKRIVLHLYFISSIGYTLLQKALLLPAQTKLKNIFMPQSMDVDENLMQMLKHKVDLMTDEQKQCTLCVSLIKLKPNLYYNIGKDRVNGFHEIDGVVSPEPAKVALVAMTCGLYKTWEQLISMVFLANTTYTPNVQEWVTKLLTKLLDIGLNVRAFVTDVDTAYTYMFTQQFSLIIPFISIKDRKIYVIFDVPHLMKAMRNIFMTNSFYFNAKIASWSDLVLCHEHDKKKGLLRLLPKITDDHIHPHEYLKDDTKLAVQVTSLSCSSAISNYVDLNILNETATGTSLFLLKMNNLFDMFNSDGKPTKNNYKKPFVGDEFQKLFLTEMMSFFKELIIIKHSENNPRAAFIEGFQTTISSLLQLFNEIQIEYGHLYTRKLNSDNLNIFLKKIVEHECEYPTVRQLIKHFNDKFSKDLLISPVECKSSDNMDDMMIQAQIIVNTKKYKNKNVTNNTLNKYSNIEIRSELYKKIKIPEENTLVFLAGFIFMKCYIEHGSCKELNKKISDIQVSKKSITTPLNFVAFINVMEAKFRQYFLKNTIRANLLEGLLEELDNVPYNDQPCSHFPLLFAKKMYARLRICMMLKFNNNHLK